MPPNDKNPQQRNETTTSAPQRKDNKFVFVGDPNDNYSGRHVITVKGVRFIRNKPSTVPDDKIDFFSKHNHFLTPEKADRLLERLAEADENMVNAMDFEGDDDDHGGRTPTRRTVRQVKQGNEGGKGEGTDKDYDSMSMAALHMEVAEQSKTAPGNATKEQLIAILKGE